MKIVINNEYGRYSLSEAAYQELGLEWDGYGFADEIKRNDPRLVACVEKLGPLARGSFASLMVVEIPDDVEWEIESYDGNEWVAEKHRTWP
jgi:hypothetical protein